MLIGASAFVLLSAASAAWYLFIPGDQIILLSIVALPTDIVFFALAPNNWGLWQQTVAIAFLGALQYGVVGYIVGRLIGVSRPTT